MPKVILYSLFILLFLPTTVSARNTVNIKTDTDSNYQSSSNINNETNIRIETNGEIKEYHGSGEDVNIQSSDGKTTVKVNNNGATNNITSNSTSNITSKTNIKVNSNTNSSPSPSPSPSPSNSPEATVAGVFKDNSEKEEKSGFWEYVRKEIAEFFSFFS